MPFDAAGNFSRSYNYTQDRDNGIKILASHVDGEFDNFATGMNAVFFRDGRVPMQADLRLNINGITGLKDGALGSPAIKFNTDGSTGVYMPGLNQFGIQVNAVQRGVFTTTGFDVTGVLSQGGAAVATQAFVTGAYAPLASPALTGVPTAPTAAAGTNTTQIATTAFVNAYVPKSGGTMTGNLTAPVFLTSGAAGGLSLAPRDGTSPSPVIYSGTTGRINFYDGSADRWRMDGAGNFTLVQNNTRLQFTDTVGTSPNFISQNDNNFVFYGTDATGGLRGIWSCAMRNSSSPLNIAVPLTTTQGGSHGGVHTFNSTTLFNSGAPSSQADSSVAQLYMQYPGSGGGWKHAIVTRHAGGTLAGNAIDFYLSNGTQAGNPSIKIATLGDGVGLTVNGKINAGDDFNTTRGFAPTTGAVFFGNSGSRYLYWDATSFNLNGPLIVAGNITSTSDARLKSNVRPLENARQLVSQLNGKRFDMYGKPDVGLIAQDVQRVLPELIRTDDRGMLSLDYGRLVAVLIEDNNSLAARLDRAGL